MKEERTIKENKLKEDNKNIEMILNSVVTNKKKMVKGRGTSNLVKTTECSIKIYEVL